MAKTETTKSKEDIISSDRPKCGIIMPISPIDGCNAEHWLEMLSILKNVADEAGFEPNLVSDADDIGIIQKRIIQNVYSNEIVICDVSGKNPNVMFELGMRLAFDKATVIIKDDKTDYSFDTGVIEHLGYPRDLRFHKILEFKENLKKKLESTYKKSTEDANYSTFLKNFGEYKIAHLQEKEISSENFIMSSLEEIRNEIKSLRISQRNSISHRPTSNLRDNSPSLVDVFVKDLITKFFDDKRIKGEKPINIQDVYDFVEQNEDARNMCGSVDEVRKVVRRVI